ncbi:MAG: hypothetical protein LUH10_02170 [Tannerellaceae bacterium]|nr:hypothetical protein [Tannerellaceae bacterium]
MDNLGDWLYIIVLIIAGISGLLGSGKKKKRNPTDVLGQPGYDEVEERPTNEKSFWDLFEEELENPNPAVKPITCTPVATPKKEKKIAAPHYPHDVAFSPVQKKNTPILDEESELDHYMLEDESFTDMTELRKAIIYTEIINRKY